MLRGEGTERKSKRGAINHCRHPQQHPARGGETQNPRAVPGSENPVLLSRESFTSEFNLCHYKSDCAVAGLPGCAEAQLGFLLEIEGMEVSEKSHSSMSSSLTLEIKIEYDSTLRNS